MIWWVADLLYPGVRFTKYAVLGDDVVICDTNVALLYAHVVETLGVSISPLKSLMSNSGCIEFAKSFLVDALTKDLSPVSMRCLSNFFHHKKHEFAFPIK